jgi:beta-lactamase class A
VRDETNRSCERGLDQRPEDQLAISPAIGTQLECYRNRQPGFQECLKTTRLDRIEPDLNQALPGDPRDTTSPAAMLGNLRSLVLGDVLSSPSRRQLTAWLLGNKTGGTRLRARLPKDWRVGDKTGAGEHGTTNDVGLFWPPDRDPVIVCAYLTTSPGSPEQRNATLAAVGEAVAHALRS